VTLTGGAFLLYNLLDKAVPTDPAAAGFVANLAGSGSPGFDDGAGLNASFSDPFGIIIDENGELLVADGGDSNRLRRITRDSVVSTAAGSNEGFADGAGPAAQLNTPSFMALDPDGEVIVADTGNHSIRRLSKNGTLTTIAGAGQPGFRDGPAAEAAFDAPIGVAVDGHGNIFVADTYNDAIRMISKGTVSTLAGGGKPGYADGQGSEALFDTPCGLAIDPESGILYVADAGNNAIRSVTPLGEVGTIAGGARGRTDGVGTEATFDQPTGIARTHDGFLFVTDEASGRIRRISPGGVVTTFAGSRLGYREGAGSQVRFNGPTGIAVDRKGNVYVADTQNYLIRRLSPVAPAAAQEDMPVHFVQPPGSDSTGSALDNRSPGNRFASSIPSFTITPPLPWPFNPQDRWRELSGVAGEARGAPGGVALDHLHSGVDIRAAMGEAVISVIDEKVSSAIPAWDYGRSNEGIKLGIASYIHIRVGRDKDDRIAPSDKFKPRSDQNGLISGVRVRRGARFRTGDFIGTVNRLYHLHLNVGPWNAQTNPILFPFIGFTDTIAPVIEPDGIEVVNTAGEPFKETIDGRLIVWGDVDIIVTAYDQVDGNSRNRKLGLFRAGYQLLHEDGSPATGFEAPLVNIDFERLPPDDETVFVVYAAGSSVIAYSSVTRFRYIVTNRLRGNDVRDGFLRTSALSPGNYIVRVLAEDSQQNRAAPSSTDLPITVVSR
jgi:DNA-binding beta-propeller fold protein YncE